METCTNYFHNCAFIFYTELFIQAIATHKLQSRVAKMAPFITCFMVVCFFDCKEKYPAA
jgi:hypothetical protein